VSLTIGQQIVSTVPTFLFNAPPGWATITVQSGSASTASAYLGFSTALTSSIGYEIPVQQSVSWVGSGLSKAGGSIYGVTTASSAATLSWIISTSQ
jgi:hypothetical protein